jgi:hypothetical protein
MDIGLIDVKKLVTKGWTIWPSDKLSKLEEPISSLPLQEIRIFSDAGIQASIDKALASLAPDKSGAVIQINVSQAKELPPKLNAAIAARMGEHWSIAAAYERDWTTQLQSGEAQIRFSW